MRRPRNVILAGMPGTGKTAVGQALAEALGWGLVDLDAEIAAGAGRPIQAIFRGEGEAGFRAREGAAVAALAGLTRHVVVTGGWTVGNSLSRARLEALGTVVCLTASPQTIAERLADQAGGELRPILGEAPSRRGIARLWASRRGVYDSFPWQVATDGHTVASVAREVLRLVEVLQGDAKESSGARNESSAARVVAVPVGIAAAVEERQATVGNVVHQTSGKDALQRDGTWEILDPESASVPYRVLVGNGLLGLLGVILANQGFSGRRAVVVTDPIVGSLYADAVIGSLEKGEIEATVVTMGLGDAAKSLGTVDLLYSAFLSAGLDRDGLVIALGGGVVGDTAGFAAATYLRGVTLVLVPTTLLAMVDASIGGKNGVNLAAGKNLAGTFHPPALVVADTTVLTTLPDPVLRGGMAEVVKAALIADPELFKRLGEEALPDSDDHLAWSELVARAAGVKARIVSADLLEHGQRIWLNLGHTFGHALEQATDYDVSHGEAVAVGLVAAARLAERIGRAEPGLAARVGEVLGRLGLPRAYGETRAGRGKAMEEDRPAVTSERPTVGAILRAMAVDKKRQSGGLRFVLPLRVGAVEVVAGVTEAEVRAVVELIVS